MVKGACMARRVCGRVCREAIYGSKPWTHQNGGVCMVEGVRGRGCMEKGVYMAKGGDMCGRGVCMAGETATAADGTHPTGMHSCFYGFLISCDQMSILSGSSHMFRQTPVHNASLSFSGILS